MSKRERRRLLGWRGSLALRWLAMLRAERVASKPTRELGELRTVMEAERARYLAQARSLNRNPRPHNDAVLWVAKHVAPIRQASRNALDAVHWLNTGKAWIAALGGAASDVDRVAGWFATWTRNSPLGSIPARSWVDALSAWTRWEFEPRKGGRPKANTTVQRLDQILLTLLRAGRLKKPSKGAQRDAEGLRARVNAARKIAVNGIPEGSDEKV